MKRKLREWVLRRVRRLTFFAWKQVLSQRYTAEEVAAWLFEYRGKEREVCMTNWIARRRKTPFNQEPYTPSILDEMRW